MQACAHARACGRLYVCILAVGTCMTRNAGVWNDTDASKRTCRAVTMLPLLLLLLLRGPKAAHMPPTQPYACQAHTSSSAACFSWASRSSYLLRIVAGAMQKGCCMRSMQCMLTPAGTSQACRTTTILVTHDEGHSPTCAFAQSHPSASSGAPLLALERAQPQPCRGPKLEQLKPP